MKDVVLNLLDPPRERGLTSAHMPVAAGQPKRTKAQDRGGLLPGINGRSSWVRRCRRLIDEHIADLGGIENTTAALRSMVRRAAVISVELEFMERRLAGAENGGATRRAKHDQTKPLTRAEADKLVDAYARTANQLRRILQAIGLERRARNLNPTLSDLLVEDERVRELRAKVQRDDAGVEDAEIIDEDANA